MNPAWPYIDELGIAWGYQDAFGKRRSVSVPTFTAIRRAITAKPDGNIPKTDDDLRVIQTGKTMPLTEPSELVLEDGTIIRPTKATPKDLPMGYHRLRSLRHGTVTRLIVAPAQCYLPRSLKAWGWAIQLYALRSRKSWGMGDLDDLRDFSRWARQKLKTNFILVNPLATAIPILPQQTSPYYPSSRRFLNPLYLSVEKIPAAAAAKKSLAEIAHAGHALNGKRLIDRDAVYQLKMAALGKIWAKRREEPGFARYCQMEGKPLHDYAVFCTLAEHFNSGWRDWPEPFRQPGGAAVARFAAEHANRLQFHRWLQWNLSLQFKTAAGALPIFQDLSVGVDPAGADAWCWQDLLAPDISIGAPPDAFNHEGQDWGMQPFIPQRLRATFYEPFRQTLKAMLRLGGGLRIDHVMGLFRLFWIPRNRPASEGTYVHYPADEMLAILAIESHRAKAIIVGEDLGTVDPSARVKLRRRNVLSYRLFWFESSPPKKYPKKALAAVSTHDLFTVAGLWSGADLDSQKRLGLHPNEPATQQLLSKVHRRLRLKANASAKEAVYRIHQLLAKAPSKLITVTLDDALQVKERPNLPGTTNASNWSLALPVPLEKIKTDRLVCEIGNICRR
jgi:4-alpha-glucanotransferase